MYGTSEENDAHFESQRSELERLAPLREALLRCDGDLAMKTARVDADPTVRAFVHANGPVARVLSNIDSEDSYLLKAAVAAGQTHVLENVSTEDPMTIANALVPLVRTLRNVETFYDTLGGVVGYQFAALELIHEQFGGPPPSFMSSTNHDSSASTDDEDMMTSNQETIDMHRPVGPDLREDGGAFATKAAMWGLEEMPRLAEVYPLGGAGDRLGLVDEMTGESLPAALLSYNGRTLIEGLIRDLTAREWLYYKVFGKQHVTPVAAMTSAAKGNHSRISTLIAQHDYFGRGESSFRLFEQPLVPVVTTLGGRWVTEGGGDLCRLAQARRSRRHMEADARPRRFHLAGRQGTEGCDGATDHQPDGGDGYHHIGVGRGRRPGGQGARVRQLRTALGRERRGERFGGARIDRFKNGRE